MTPYQTELQKEPGFRPAFSLSNSVCPGCHASQTHSFFHLGFVPVNCSALWSTEQNARDCRRGEIDLAFCPNCELIFNRHYNPDLLKYGDNYENSLDFSSSFRGYAQNLSERLIDTYDLRNKHIVGVGSGRGEFLKSLCEGGENSGVGYDPSFGGDPGSEVPNLRFVQDYYSDAYASEPVDFVSCRHVLEHIDKPFDCLRGLRRMLASHPSVILYFEVPNGPSVFGKSEMWDIIYPHVSYFTSDSLRSMFERAGFEVLDTGAAFSNQFLYLEARLAPLPEARPVEADAPVRDLVASFNNRFARTVSAWSEIFRHANQTRRRIAFWGAGAKGVTFLNVVPGASRLSPVIDSNPRKHGMYVPGTGQIIVPPQAVTEFQPDLVITLNPVYRDEIARALGDLHVQADVVSDPAAARLVSY